MVLIPGRIFYAVGQTRLVAPMLHTMLCPKARFKVKKRVQSFGEVLYLYGTLRIERYD